MASSNAGRGTPSRAGDAPQVACPAYRATREECACPRATREECAGPCSGSCVHAHVLHERRMRRGWRAARGADEAAVPARRSSHAARVRSGRLASEQRWRRENGHGVSGDFFAGTHRGCREIHPPSECVEAWLGLAGATKRTPRARATMMRE